VGSKTSQQGDGFTAKLAAPVVVGSDIVVPKGASAYGAVTEAHPARKFKGGATLKLAFTRLEIGGKPVAIKATGVTRISKGKGKRTAGLIGGGAAGGALIGGLAGGGKGLAIGALAGAGAGTAGAALTGNDRDITLRAGTSLHVRLTAPITVPQ
jgi:hypothetical protein